MIYEITISGRIFNDFACYSIGHTVQFMQNLTDSVESMVGTSKKWLMFRKFIIFLTRDICCF
jgi:hypothetical protein